MHDRKINFILVNIKAITSIKLNNLNSLQLIISVLQFILRNVDFSSAKMLHSRRDVSRKICCYPLSIHRNKLSNICIIRGQMTEYVILIKLYVLKFSFKFLPQKIFCFNIVTSVGSYLYEI